MEGPDIIFPEDELSFSFSKISIKEEDVYKDKTIEEIIKIVIDKEEGKEDLLLQKHNEIILKEELDKIIKGTSKSWAPFKATFASVIAKLKYPDWDTRKHQTQIGGKFSLRSIDRCHVSNTLFKLGLYNTGTEFALTRSFEKSEPFNKEYSGKISPVECKSAFLNIVEIINTVSTVNLLNDILIYMVLWLKQQKQKETHLKETKIVSAKYINFLDISNLCEKVNNLGAGSSVIPVIMIHSLLTIISPFLFPLIKIKSLKEHTAADNHSKSFGDIEGINKDSLPILAIEVKHKIVINEDIVLSFNKKIEGIDIPLKFIITTANMSKKVTENNVSIDTLSNFILNYIQQTIFHEKDICKLFIENFRKDILNYTNLSTEIKEIINEITTKILV